MYGSFQKMRWLLAVLAALLVAAGTPYGPGLTPDTVLYLETADVLRSQGRLPETLLEGIRPGSAVPPLYPVALALVGGGLDSLAPVRWLNVVLFAASTWLFTGLVFRLSSGSNYYSTLASLGFVTSIVLLEIHTAAWSEPLFILLQLLVLREAAHYLEAPTWKSCLGAALLVSLTPLCRFAGVTIMATGILAVMLFRRARWVELLVFAGVSALPLAVLLSFNRSQSGSATGTGGLSPYLPWEDLVVLANTIAAWVIPGIDRFQVVPGQDVIAICIVLAIGLFYGATLRYADVARDRLMAVSLLMMIVYPGVILALITFLKSDLPLEQRIMCPMFVYVMLTAPALAARVPRESWLGRFSRVGFVLLVAVYLPPLLVGVSHLANQGRGYTGPPYEAPQIYRFLKERDGQPFHTNDNSAAWLKVRRVGLGLPSDKAEGPILFFRVGHPVPPRHQEAVKRPTSPPDEALQRLLDLTPARLVKREGQVELYLPQSMSSPF